jgi:Mrp family chromosome partitioning ATPase
MSTTNKAFIKAYRHDEPQPARIDAPSTNSVESNPTARGHATAEMSVNTTTVAASASERSTIARRPSPNAEKQPLSSYISSQTERTQDLRIDEPVEGARFEPGTTVASFRWPAICRALVQQCGPQLENVTRLLWSRASEGNSLIGVFSLFRRGGATTTTLCLASRAATRSRRVIIGDGNFRNPQLANLLDVVPTAGWEEVLKNTAPLNDAVVRATDDKVDLLALGGHPVPDPQFRAEGLQAAVTAGILRHNYDLAIVDLGTFFDPVSQPVLLELVANMGMDAAVAVAGPRATDRRDIATIEEFFRHTNCEFLGIIENRIVESRAA